MKRREKKINEATWLGVLVANSTSNLMYAIYVVTNKSTIIASPLWPNSNFKGKPYILSPIINLDKTNKLPNVICHY